MSLGDTLGVALAVAFCVATLAFFGCAMVGEQKLNRLHRLRAAAKNSGLEVVSHHMGWGTELARIEFRGARSGVLLRFTEERLGRGRTSSTLVAVAAPTRLRLERRSPVRAVTEPGIGNELFDRHVTITQGAELGMSVLNAATRRGLYELRRCEDRHWGTLLGDGVLTVSRRGKLREQDFEEWATRLVELCTRLAPPADPKAALFESARQDSDWEVRVRMLEQLRSSFPADAEVLALIGERLQVAEPDEALAIACRFPGPGSEAALRKLAATADAARPPPGTRARALEALVRQRPGTDVSALVIQALGSFERSLRLAAIAAVTELELHSALEPLCALLPFAGEYEQVAALDALGFLGNGRAESAAISLLGSGSSEVQRAAARALGQLGTIQAVAALAPLARGSRSRRGVDEEASRAMRAIQARLGVQGAGALQLAQPAPATGAVGLATQPGALAMGER